MSFWKFCPICIKRKIYRREIWTCGSPACTAQWRSYSAEAKERAVELAASHQIDPSSAFTVMPPAEAGGQVSPQPDNPPTESFEEAFLSKHDLKPPEK